MYKKTIAALLLAASFTVASGMLNPLTAQEEQNKPAPNPNTAKSFIVTQPCDILPKMLDVIKGYKEDLLFLGEGMSFAAQSGKGFMGGMMFFTNQDTGTWSMLQLYGDGTACLVMNGRNFAPYGGPKMPPASGL